MNEYLQGLAERLQVSGATDEHGLTRRWLEKAHRASQRLYRSPPYRQRKPLPLGGEALYTYERSLWPQPLEASPETVVCRNLQAAYWTGLVSLRDMLDRPITLRSYGLSHWLHELLHLLDSPRWRWSAAFSPTTFYSSVVGQRDHLYLADAAAWDLGEFLAAWQERPPDSQAILWVDTTATPFFDWEAFQSVLYPFPWLLVRARGWQAWDTHGLDLTRPGELHFVSSPAEEGLSPAATAAELARRVRSVLGTALTMAELSECCLPPAEERYLERLRANWQVVSQFLPVGSDGRLVCPGSACLAEAYGLRLGDARGAFGHRYQEVGENALQIAVGYCEPQPVLELIAPGHVHCQPSRAKELGSVRPETIFVTALPDPKQRTQILRQADLAPAPSLEQLESRLLAYDSPPPGWVLHPLLTRSGMTALATIWLALERLLPAPLRVTAMGSYFESRFLDQIMQGAGTIELVPDSDIVFAESVSYDWELTPLDARRLRNATGVILDTTLTGQKVSLGHVHHPGLRWAVRFFSGLKLDQGGLELENCGVILVAGPPDTAAQLHHLLREARRITGNLPTPLERQRLAPPFVLNAPLAALHGDQVFAHNALLARSLEPTAILRRVVHNHPAPFVVLHLHDTSIANHRRLAGALLEETSKRKVDFQRGASFGFVHHRHEFVIPVLKENRALFKVAMGSSDPGPVIELLREVLSRPCLRGKMAPPPRDWSAPSGRLLRFLAGSP